ncbi:MAG: hypothetical protein ACI8V2_005302, partial [Candidatus Latescibacterota bacterium]
FVPNTLAFAYGMFCLTLDSLHCQIFLATRAFPAWPFMATRFRGVVSIFILYTLWRVSYHLSCCFRGGLLVLEDEWLQVQRPSLGHWVS